MADRIGAASAGGLALSPAVTERTWPPAPSVVSKLLPLLNEGMVVNPIITLQDLLSPEVGQAPSIQRAKVYGGPLSVHATYNDIELLWGLWLGREAFSIGGTAQPEMLAAGVYRHTFEIDPQYHSHAWTFEEGVQLGSGVTIGHQILPSGTLAIEKEDVLWEFRGWQVIAGVFSAGPRETKIRLNSVAYDLDLASVTNPDLSAASLPSFEDIRLLDMTLRIGPQSTITPLDSSNDVDVDRFQFGLTYSVSVEQRADSGLFIGEPRRVGVPQIRGVLGKPRYSDDVQSNRAFDSTPQMASAVFEGPEIGATGFNYELGVYFPHLELTNPNMAVRGAELIREDYAFQAGVPGDDYAGMPATTRRTPIIVQVVSGESGHVFY